MNYKKIVVIFIGLAALTILAYLPAFNSGYLLDDNILIKTNPAIRDPGNIPYFFISDEARMPRDFSNLRGDIYRPIQLISYTVSYALWKENIRLFHAENVLFHILNGFLVYLVLWRLFRNGLISIFGSALFLVHPVQVEAVTYLSGRADLLSLLFFLASLLTAIIFIDGKHPASRILRYVSIALFALALLSKEMAATLPLILGLYVLCLPQDGIADRARRAVRCVYPYIIILLFYWILRTVNLGKVAQTSLPQDIYFKISVMGQVFFGYLKLIFFPSRLTFYHDFDIIIPESGMAAFLHLVPMVLYIALCVFMYRKDRETAFFLSAYLVALLPVSNIIPIKAFMQERFLYLPVVFIIMALGGVSLLMKRAKAPIMAFACLAVAVLSTLTFARNLDWKDQETLMKKEMVLHPEQGIFYFDFGHSAFMAGRYDEALDYLMKARNRKLSAIYHTKVYDTMGNCYTVKGDIDKALDSYMKALEATPDYVYSLNSVGNILFKRGQYEDARKYFYAAHLVWPNDPLFNKNIGSASMMLGDKPNALKYWKRSLEVKKDQPDVEEFIRTAESGR